MFEKKKKLIIVHTKDSAKYANYLQTMVSSSDDDGETIVGVKDGSVATVVWSEKDYLAQKPTLANSDYILFVGASKKLKDEYFGVQEKFNKFGMTYSWLGKHGLLSVNSGIKRKDYDQFLSYATDYISDIQRKMDTKGQSAAKDAATVGAGVAAEAASVGAAVAAGSGVAALLPFAVAVFAPAGAVAVTTAAGIKLFRYLKEKKLVAEQQFTCLILKFYLEGIQQFLNQ